MAKKKKSAGRKKSSGAVQVAPSRRRYVRRTPAAVVPPAPIMEAFGPIVMQGQCILCQEPLSKHFSETGRFVGCLGKRVTEGALYIPLFVPPIVIQSDVLNGVLQQYANGGGHTPVVTARQMERRVLRMVAGKSNGKVSKSNGKGQVGRQADVLFPLMPKLDAEHGEKAQKVFALIHQNKGITLSELVEKAGYPKSTVWSTVTKLVTLKAIQKQAPDVKTA